MLEMGTSGLMSGDGKRGGFNVSTRVRPRLYNSQMDCLVNKEGILINQNLL